MKFLWFNCWPIIVSTAFAVFVCALGFCGYFLHKELGVSPDPVKYCSMAEDAMNNYERFKSEGHSAFILGHTGEVGRALVDELNRLKIFKKVVLIGRRKISLPLGPEFEQRIVDYENIDDHKDAFKDLDTGFCCLGTTKGKAGVQGFIRVDHDYVLMSAEIAKADKCKHFSLVSSQGANKNSTFLYPRTKGQAEEALKVIHFDRLSIYRPGVLMVDREESRPFEFAIRQILKPVSYFFPTAITTPVSVMAMAMINNVIAKGEKVELYENKAIHDLSGISKGVPIVKTSSKNGVI